MADIAQLGLAVDSRQVKEAEKDLRSFESAAKSAGTSANGLKNVLQQASFDKITTGLRSANDNLKGIGAAQAPLKAVSTAMASMLIPANAIGIAFGLASGAAIEFYNHMTSKGPTTETILKEHDRLIGLIKSSYDNATQSAKNFFEQSRDVTRLQLLQQEIELRGKLREETGKVISQSTTFGNLGDFFSGTKQVKEQLAPFEDAIFRLKEGFDKGAPAIRDFTDEVAKIGLASPQLQKLAIDLISSAKNAEEFAVKMQQVKDALALLSGQTLSEDQLGRLGLPKPRAIMETKDAYDRMVESIEKRIERGQIEAETWGMTEAAAAKYRVQQELINAAKRADIELSPEQVANNERLASAMEAQAARLDGLQKAQEGLNAVRDVAKGFARDLMNGVSAAEAFKNALDRIAQRLMDMAIDNLFAKAFGGAGSGGGGLLAALFGGGGGGGQSPVMTFGGFGPHGVPTFHDGGVVGGDGGPLRYVHPSVFANAPRFHSGGMVGLQPGERPIIAQDGETVIPKGGASGSVVVKIEQNNSFVNADPNSEARMRQWAAQTKDAAVAEAVQQVARVSGNTPSYRSRVSG